jgi:Tfp pilus assembly protein PilE
MKRKRICGVTIIESVIAAAIASIAMLGVMTFLGYARMHNEIEQERSRAHELVCQALEIERYKLFTWTQTQSQKTIWDSGTPDDYSDDTIGTLEIIVRNPKTNQVLSQAPDPATLVEIEATLTWNYRGGSASGKVLHETVMTYKAP